MGGHAHGLPLRRLLPDEYIEISSKLITSLHNLTYPVITATLIPPAPGKLDYGDVDILITRCLTDEQLHEIGLFDRKQHHSYLYRWQPNSSEEVILVQVDLDVIEETNRELETFIKSYGLVGHICGIYFKDLGLDMTLRGDGLYKGVDLQGQKAQFLICNDLQIICEDYLQLDYTRWKEGFATKEQLFEWLMPVCPLVSHKFQKRAIFQEYVQWLDAVIIHRGIRVGKLEERRKALISRMIQNGAQEDLQRQVQEQNERMEVKSRYKSNVNGEVVQSILEEYQIVVPKDILFGRLMCTLHQLIPENIIPDKDVLTTLVLEAAARSSVDANENLRRLPHVAPRSTSVP